MMDVMSFLKLIWAIFPDIAIIMNSMLYRFKILTMNNECIVSVILKFLGTCKPIDMRIRSAG